MNHKRLSLLARVLARLTQENAELKRMLALTEDAAAKGDKARDVADAQEQIIAELREAVDRTENALIDMGSARDSCLTAYNKVRQAP